MRKTPNYNMNLPDGEDYYNIEQFNENATITDTTMHNLQASIAANASEIQTMKQTFQAGVEACYDACVTKGSTPASYALSDVVEGILNISSGGGYSMFPQEFPQRDDQYNQYDNINLSNNEIIYYAHILSSGNPVINIDINFSTKYASSHTLSFALLVDGDVVVPNMGSITINPNGEYFDNYSFSYTYNSNLSSDYHIISVKTSVTSGSIDTYWFMTNLHGTGFTAITYPGVYFNNGNFLNFIPSNFVNPTNPTVGTLGYGTGCGTPVVENDITYMNRALNTTFDSGVCYHLQGIDMYLEEIIVIDPDTGEEHYEYVERYPTVEDTLVFNNTTGKFVFHHLRSREFPGDIGGCNSLVHEYHYFILPIIGHYFKLFEYVNVQAKITSKTEDIGWDTKIYGILVKRTGQNTVDSDTSSSPWSEYVELAYKEVNEEIILSFEHFNFGLSTDVVNFIGFMIQVDTAEEEFTLEIDKIWGSHTSLNDNY